MKQITVDEARAINGGNYHCSKCGLTTWGNAVKSHALIAHGSTKYVHFHWSGPSTGFYRCSKMK